MFNTHLIHFAEYRLFYRSLLQKRRIILWSLRTEATAYVRTTVRLTHILFTLQRSVCVLTRYLHLDTRFMLFTYCFTHMLYRLTPIV